MKNSTTPQLSTTSSFEANMVEINKSLELYCMYKSPNGKLVKSITPKPTGIWS